MNDLSVSFCIHPLHLKHLHCCTHAPICCVHMVTVEKVTPRCYMKPADLLLEEQDG